jgi:hypothetical protein
MVFCVYVAKETSKITMNEAGKTASTTR